MSLISRGELLNSLWKVSGLVVFFGLAYTVGVSQTAIEKDISNNKIDILENKNDLLTYKLEVKESSKATEDQIKEILKLTSTTSGYVSILMDRSNLEMQKNKSRKFLQN